MKTVLICKESLLSMSETFIAEQVRALHKFQPKYLGLTRAEPCLGFEGEPLYLAGGRGKLSQWRATLYRKMPIAPLFHRRVGRLHGDLIHIHFAPDAAQLIGLAERFHLPLVVTLHGYDVTMRQDFPLLYSRLWKRTSLFLCDSKFLRDTAEQAGFPAEKLRVHYIGIDLTKFHLSSAPRTPNLVLFVGRLVEKKGCEVLLRAMELVRAAVPDASLVIIGDGPLRPALTSLSSTLNLRCQFLGPQPSAVVQSWMAKASIFCTPSQTAPNGDCEGLGIVFLEAQACGLPVVSTLHGGIPEAVKNGETGILVPEGNPEALAQALLEYLINPELAREHGLAGQAWVTANFDLFKQTALLEDTYAEVLSQVRIPA